MVARSDRTVQNTTTITETLDRTVEDRAANCLMLLSRVGERGGGGGDRESRVFRCKTCMQEFSSFQALGGHRASHNATNHKKIIKNSSSGEEQSSSLSSGPVIAKKNTKNTRPHRCPICGLEFPLGQALGGHMRKHRNEEISRGSALVTRCFFPEAATTSTMFTTFKKSSNGKRVACLDFGSDSMDSTINLKLEL